MASHTTFTVMGIILLLYQAALISATVYIVGESSGWTTGVDFSSWTNGKIFVVGDSLSFNYAPATHTVNEVKAKDYKTCTASNYVSTDSTGSTTIRLKKTGTHYFVCSIPGHCSSGMKLAVTVFNAHSSSPSPSPSQDSPFPSPLATPPLASSTIPAPITSQAGSSSPTESTKRTNTSAGHRKAQSLVSANLLSLLIVSIF